MTDRAREITYFLCHTLGAAPLLTRTGQISSKQGRNKNTYHSFTTTNKMFHAIIIYQHIHKHSILSEKQQENHLKRYLLKITKFCRFSLFSFIIVCFIYLVRHILCKINNIHLRKEGLQCPAEIFSELFQVTSIIAVFEVFDRRYFLCTCAQDSLIYNSGQNFDTNPSG